MLRSGTSLDALLTARKKAGLSQAEVARRMGMNPPSPARIEASLYHSALTVYLVMRGSGVRMTSPPAIA